MGQSKTDIALQGLVIVGGIALLVAAVFSWNVYRWFVPHRDTYPWNELMTITVQTPDGIVTGEAVRQVIARYAPNPSRSVASTRWQMEGEALALELRPEAFLFVTPGNPNERIIRFAPDAFPPSTHRFSPALHETILTLPGTYPFTEETGFPDMIVVPNIADPVEAIGVTPGALADVMGPGFAILSVTVEITDREPDMGRIEQVFPTMFDQRDEYGVIERIPRTGHINATAPIYSEPDSVWLPFFYPSGQWRAIWHRYNTECVRHFSDWRQNRDGPPMCR